MSTLKPDEGTSTSRFGAERVNSFVQTVAIVAAGAWAVYTFIYEARIKPGLEPPAVSVTTELVKAGERDDHVAIRSTVTRKNVGQTAVRVLGLTYNVVGVRARFESDSASATKPTGTIDEAGQIAEAPGYTLSEPGTVILRQGVLFAGATDEDAKPSDLAPGETLSRDLIVYADRSKNDFVRFEVSLVYAKEDDPPVKLRFEEAEHGRLTLGPRADCRTDPEPCRRLKTTDFAAEFSLW